MSLVTLVEKHNIENEMNFDTAVVSDFIKLFESNFHDCKITIELAIGSDAGEEMDFIALFPVFQS